MISSLPHPPSSSSHQFPVLSPPPYKLTFVLSLLYRLSSFFLRNCCVHVCISMFYANTMDGLGYWLGTCMMIRTPDCIHAMLRENVMLKKEKKKLPLAISLCSFIRLLVCSHLTFTILYHMAFFCMTCVSMASGFHHIFLFFSYSPKITSLLCIPFSSIYY